MILDLTISFFDIDLHIAAMMQYKQEADEVLLSFVIKRMEEIRQVRGYI